MVNSLLLFSSLVFTFGITLLGYWLFGKTALYCISALATVIANIEVMLMINAFGMEQTLGNVLFAMTFLATDILSECEGKKAANKAVWIGIFVSLFFLVLSQSWLLYQPIVQDDIAKAFRVMFSRTPRLIFSSLVVYAISQFLDVWIYHKWWSFTEKKCGDKRSFLWLRNNGSTLISQLINSFLFTLFAFVGRYGWRTIISIFLSSYVIFIFTSLLDTPVLYLARKLNDRRIIKSL